MTSFSIEENLELRGYHCDQIFGLKLVVILLLQTRLVGLPLLQYLTSLLSIILKIRGPEMIPFSNKETVVHTPF